MKRAILAVLFATACVDATPATTDDTIDRPTACDEQADAWCERIGFPTAACRMEYVVRCERGGPGGEIANVDQAACLDAIAVATSVAGSFVEPATCVATWN